jgi:hypothetical protein
LNFFLGFADEEDWKNEQLESKEEQIKLAGLKLTIICYQIMCKVI